MSARSIATIGLLLCIGVAAAQVKPRQDVVVKKADDSESKEVSGMSVVGNSETPKSLTIIPWKSSEIGRDTDFRSSLLSQEIAPIDKPSFLRGLDFYKLSHRH